LAIRPAVRRRPSLRVEIAIEGVPVLHFLADSEEDEQRLREWLRQACPLIDLAASFEGILDDLDAWDERKASR
jgi:hypothetical protein